MVVLTSEGVAAVDADRERAVHAQVGGIFAGDATSRARTAAAVPSERGLVSLLGFIAGPGLYHDLPDSVRVGAGTGFCGAFTTFSTFTFETSRLIEEGAQAEAARNVAGTSWWARSPPAAAWRWLP